MCDMYDLFCNSSEKNEENGVSCKPVKTDLQYTINSEQCGNYFGTGYVGHQCYQANPTCLKTNVPTPEAQALQAPQTLVADLCWLSDNACNMIFADGSKILAAGACTGLSAATMEACKLFANKLDPLCQKETAIFEKACKASVATAGAFGAGECKKLASNAIGCPKNDELAAKELSYGFQLYSICPPAKYAAFNVHTMAQMEVDFQNSCAEVAGEIEARANGENGWVDPHNDGHYKLVSSTANLIETSRQTHYYKYTDDQAFSMTPNGSGGCTVKMCSVSQGTSADSGGTDMCDMYDLFCNSSEKNEENGVSCKPVKTDLQYTINSEQCGNYFGTGYVGHQCYQANPTCLKTNKPTPEVQAFPGSLQDRLSHAEDLQTLGGDLCWLADGACEMIFADGSKVLAAGACAGLNAAALEACKLFANKLDPFCQKEMPIFEQSCKASIGAAGEFGLGQCRKIAGNLIGCDASALKAPEPVETMHADLCWLGGEACDMIMKGSKVLSAGACTGLTAATMEACKLFANKLDPLCEKETAIFEKACEASIQTAGTFGAQECKKFGANLLHCQAKPKPQFAFE